jgi:hypothetical protein
MSRLVEQRHPRAVARAAWPAQHAGSTGYFALFDRQEMLDELLTEIANGKA